VSLYRLLFPVVQAGKERAVTHCILRVQNISITRSVHMYFARHAQTFHKQAHIRVDFLRKLIAFRDPGGLRVNAAGHTKQLF
jgi:hypothetical protein